MTYELVKYRYGLAPIRYTAYCLTPKLKKPTEVKWPNGTVIVCTNGGIGSPYAVHFQTVKCAKEFLKANGQPDTFDWKPITE